MYRAIVYFGLVSALDCALGIAIPQQASTLTVFLPSGIYAYVGLLLSSILLYFGVGSFFRRFGFKICFGFIGLVLISLFIIGMVTPTFFGYFNIFINPSNLFPFLILGTGFMLAAIEYDRPSVVEELLYIYRPYDWIGEPKNRSSTEVGKNRLHLRGSH